MSFFFLFGCRLPEFRSATNRCGAGTGVAAGIADRRRGSIVRVLAPGDGGSHRSVAAGLLSPRRGGFFSSAVVGSSFRGVKAITALRRLLQSPSLLGFRIFRLFFLVSASSCGCEFFLVTSEERLISDGKSEVACEALGGCGERGWMRSRHGD